ncbi:hypothetical protein E2562_025851 [Oryza meyeriana var. granulata]|uniref:Uncharacterized protein n=1 Tax=Oryza meyeriana var. granulata TaxID=110450 RepID=A0A6G1E231_9ORYZ|nr:hypothetical protein E2562_025851 [Oryza meyeriana var. granulata]
MGNLLASRCVYGGGAGVRRPLVIGTDGRPVWVEEATGAAELMIEAPGHVVARAADVAKERRVRAMAAHEPLRDGEVYLLVPASRAGAWLGDREVEAIGRLVVSGGKKGSKRRKSGGNRIFPEVVDTSAVEDVVERKGIDSQAQAQAHGLRPRQWRPALDTIYEA